MRALLHNVTTAMGDASLIGETLMTPIKKCIEGYQYIFSILHPRLTICQRTGEVFKRSVVFLAATLAVVPSVVLASAGQNLNLASATS